MAKTLLVFCEKKRFYKKIKVTEVKKLKEKLEETKGLHSLALRNFSIEKQKIGYFSSNFVGKFPRKAKN